ncbi:hypothetical protein FRC02_009449 [Tulasnella sp. 418]|nr:hypothetical protein FRC02_009449 [Tulasnella sp. 418]
MSASKTQPSVPFTDEALQCNRVMNAFYTGHTWESEQILPYVFQRLVAPDVPDTFVTDWAICITDRAMVLLNIEDNQEEGVKVETIIHLFIAACIRHGVIGTMLEVSRLRADKNGRSSYMALQCIAWLCKCTVASQDKFIRKDIASKDGFRALLEEG